MTIQQLQRFQKWGFFALSALVLLPFCLISRYHHPVGMHEWDWISNLAGQFDGKLWEYQMYYYKGCMGRFSSTFLMSLTPFWYSLSNFQYFFPLVILLFIASTAFFLRSFFQEEKYSTSILTLTLGVVLAYYATISNLFDTVYHFSSICTYQIGAIFLLLFLGLALPILRGGKTSVSRKISVFFLGFMLPGFNEACFIALFYIGFWVFLDHFYHKKNIKRDLILLYIFIGIGTAIAVSALGNFSRLAVTNGAAQFGVGKAIALTIGSSVFALISWFSTLTLPLISLLSLPILINFAQNSKVKSAFSNPVLWWIASFCFVPLALFPFIIGTKGGGFAERYVNLVFLMFGFGFLGFLQSCTVYLVEKHPSVKWLNSHVETQIVKIFLGILLLTNLLLGSLSVNREKGNFSPLQRIQVSANSGRVWQSLVSGEALQYDKEVRKEYEEVKNCGTDTCFVSKPSVFPFMIYEAISDRRNAAGDPFMGRALGTNVKIIKYK